MVAYIPTEIAHGRTYLIVDNEEGSQYKVALNCVMTFDVPGVICGDFNVVDPMNSPTLQIGDTIEIDGTDFKDGLVNIEQAPYSFEEFVANAEKYYRRHSSVMRKGQSYMNFLHMVNPDLYEYVTGKKFDPFYNDGLLPIGLEMMGANWDTFK